MDGLVLPAPRPLAGPIYSDRNSKECCERGVGAESPASELQLSGEAAASSGCDQCEYGDCLGERTSLGVETVGMLRHQQQHYECETQTHRQSDRRAHDDADQDREWSHGVPFTVGVDERPAL